MGVGGTCGTSSLLLTPFCLGSVQLGSGKGEWVVPPGPCTDPGSSWSCSRLFHSRGQAPLHLSRLGPKVHVGLSLTLFCLSLPKNGVQGFSEVPPNGLAVSAVIWGKSFLPSEC